ncbi:MAG: hypothetical protein ATN31_06580 [Candidatus Epulonipiscioides saccharophilum]|nr:MAG: hypothetical protein ATN31_06580 [Epulopiscium sp. AS2M-Bin001]
MLKYLIAFCLTFILSVLPTNAQPKACGEMIEVHYELNCPVVTNTIGKAEFVFRNMFSSKKDDYHFIVGDIITNINLPEIDEDLNVSFYELINIKDISPSACAIVSVERNGSSKQFKTTFKELMAEIEHIAVSNEITSSPVPIYDFDIATMKFRFINPCKISENLLVSTNVYLINSTDFYDGIFGHLSDTRGDFCTFTLSDVNFIEYLAKDYSHLEIDKVYMPIENYKTDQIEYSEVILFETVFGNTKIKTNPEAKQLLDKLANTTISGIPLIKNNQIIGFASTNTKFFDDTIHLN